MVTEADMRKASPTTSQLEELFSDTKPSDSVFSDRFDPESVMSAAAGALGAGAFIHPTSAYPELEKAQSTQDSCLSRQRVDSPLRTEPKLLLSDPSIPKWTSDYSSKPTTGPQSSNGNAIPGGQASTGSSGTSVKQCQGIGRMHLDGAGYCQTCVPQPFGKPLFFHDSPYAGMTEHRASAMDHQVGGDHYRKLSIQPVEFIHKNGLGFLAGNVIKYVCRYKAKAGVQDLLKAKHYIEMLIEQERQDP